MILCVGGTRSASASLCSSRWLRDVLAIPGMLSFCDAALCTNELDFVLGSAVVERLFSGGSDKIALRRASLQPDAIRILMILKQHI